MGVKTELLWRSGPPAPKNVGRLPPPQNATPPTDRTAGEAPRAAASGKDPPTCQTYFFTG